MSNTTSKMHIKPLVYLASASARRKDIMKEIGIPCRLLAVDVDEIVAATAHETVEENAKRKLFKGLTIADKGIVVIGADTVLEVQGQILGKPPDETTAIQYLQKLSGCSAIAYSAVAVAVAGALEGSIATETAEVHFKILTKDVISWYLSTKESMDRAGAFGIGQLGEILTDSVDGCYSCVSGLPKSALISALACVAGEQIPESLRNVPDGLIGTRIQLRSLAIHLD